MAIGAARNYREFLKEKQKERDEAARLQQKGGSTKQVDREIMAMDQEQKKKDVRPQDKQSEAPEKPKDKLKEPKHKDQPDLKKIRRERALLDRKHDMRDQALGQMSGIQGANIDYDELNKMAKNGIRDADELMTESLLNDGYTPDKAREIAEVMDVMKEFVGKGDGQGRERYYAVMDLNQDHDMDVIAKAFTETAKQTSVKDVRQLATVWEACEFDYGTYEKLFDRIRAQDPEADRALDRLDMAMGIER